MQEFSTAGLLFSFLITWIVVLTPPLLIRALRGRPIDVKIAIGICIVFYFINLILFIAMGSQSKSHAALFLGAWISYYVLRWQTNSSSARVASEERKSLGYEEPQPEGVVQSGIVSPTVQSDTQLTHHRWYQKVLHRPMARLYISFTPSAIVVFLIILIAGYLDVQRQAESDATMALADLTRQAATQQRSSASPLPDINPALDEMVRQSAEAQERCDAYRNNPRPASGTDYDGLAACILLERQSPRDIGRGDIWTNVHDKVPVAVLVWLAISSALFALLAAISIFKLEVNRGWKRLSVVAGTIASLMVLLGSIFFSGEFDLNHNTVYVLVRGLVLGLATLPLTVLILLGGRNLMGWIRSGFEQN